MESNMSQSLSGSYLSFKLTGETFAAHASKVISILEYTKITPIPKSPNYMNGVINLRGKVLPIIDTRTIMGMPNTQISANTSIIVVETIIDGKDIQLGMLVDAVMAVIEVKDNDVLPAPNVGGKIDNHFINGVISIEGTFILLLDIDALFESGGVQPNFNAA